MRVAVLACRWLAISLMSALLFSCTIGEGEGPRFIGRVVSVNEHELCLGPNSSSPTGTCGSIPQGVTRLPRVGDCVSLFGHPFDHGTKIRWSRSDLSRRVDDKECSRASGQTSTTNLASP
jgi:hypothetical protein